MVPYRHAASVSRGETYRRRRPARRLGPIKLRTPSGLAERPIDKVPLASVLVHAAPLALALWIALAVLIAIII